MDFSWNDTQREIVDMAAKFAAKEISPYIEQDEANSHFRRELFSRAGEAGIIGITTDPDLGGSGLGTTEYALALEQIAYASSGYATSISVTSMVKNIIEQSGSTAQKQKYVPDLVLGKTIGAFCLTEPSSGSDASGLSTTAVKKGNKYILNGVKQFITNGMHSDVFIVMARTGGSGAKGVSSFIVEKAFGVKGGKIEKKMGMRVSPTQEILLEDVEVPEENLIGKEGEGFRVAMQGLDAGRISIASIANGVSRAALDIAVKYAKEREQFGQNLMHFQGISFLLADMATELEASRLLTYQAASLRDQGQDVKTKASMAKLKSTESCMKITTDAVQVLGGYGYMEEFTVERLMREAKVLQIVEGASQIQRIVIARGL